jgi:site-specific DNA recombinase
MPMKYFDLFSSFAKESKAVQLNHSKKAVIYTRVSTKEQADNNASLNTQRKYCDEFAERKGLEVIEYFGGTYESAKSDERREFNKMLSYVKKNKDIACIIVYSYDRFSRTGANAAYLSDQLKKKGVVTLSATQELDASSSSGAFQQNLYYLFSQFDNELRRDKSVTGMQEKLRRGYWIGTVPYGYSNLNPGKGKDPNYVINEDGKMLNLAFKLKAKHNHTLVEIEAELKKRNSSLSAKRLSDYFRNPFYCGLIVSSHIPGEIIKGKHPSLVSERDFLSVNGKLNKKDYGFKMNKDNENLPLKQFVKSAQCQTPFTGYLVKKKGLYYYKNNRVGAKENRSAKLLHDKFLSLLGTYSLAEEKYKQPLADIMLQVFIEEQADQLSNMETNQKLLVEINDKINRLEERYVFEEITKIQYDKFKAKLDAQKQEKQKYLSDTGFDLSNLEKALEKALDYSLNLPEIWSSGDLTDKRKIQNMVFPEGILYDTKKDDYRTIRVNSLFSYIPELAMDLEQKKTGTSHSKMKNSGSVPEAGIEPALPKELDFESSASTSSATRAL